MPRISAFYGIEIYMYWADHAPPHFHAVYGADEALIVIADGSIYADSLPRPADWCGAGTASTATNSCRHGTMR